MLLDDEDLLATQEDVSKITLGQIEALFREEGILGEDESLVYEKANEDGCVLVEDVSLEATGMIWSLDELIDKIRLSLRAILDMEDERDMKLFLTLELRNVLLDDDSFQKLFLKGMKDDAEDDLSITECEEVMEQVYDDIPQIVDKVTELFLNAHPINPRKFLEITVECRSFLKELWSSVREMRYKRNLINQITSPKPKDLKRGTLSRFDPLMLKVYQKMMMSKVLTPHGKSLQ